MNFPREIIEGFSQKKKSLCSCLEIQYYNQKFEISTVSGTMSSLLSISKRMTVKIACLAVRHSGSALRGKKKSLVNDV